MIEPGRIVWNARHRWRSAIVVFVLIAALGAVALALLPRTYIATARVLVNDAAPVPVNPAEETERSQEAEQQTNKELVVSQSTALLVTRQPGSDLTERLRTRWQADTGGAVPFEAWRLAWLMQAVNVDLPKDSDVFSIHAQAGDPALAARVANGFADAFVTRRLELRRAPARQYTQWLEQQQEQAREDLEATQSRMAAFQRESGLLPGDSAAADRDRLRELSQQLAIAEADAINFRNRAGTRVGESQDAQQTLVVQAIREDMAGKSAQLGELRQRFGSAYPAVQRAEAELDALRQALERETRTASRALQVANDSASGRERELQALFAGQRAKAVATASELSTLEGMQQDVKIARSTYELVNQRLTQMRLQSELPSTNAVVLDRAQPPARPSSPRYLASMFLIVVFAALMAGFVAVALEFLFPRARTTQDVGRQTGADFVSLIPALA